MPIGFWAVSRKDVIAMLEARMGEKPSKELVGMSVCHVSMCLSHCLVEAIRSISQNEARDLNEFMRESDAEALMMKYAEIPDERHDTLGLIAFAYKCGRNEK